MKAGRSLGLLPAICLLAYCSLVPDALADEAGVFGKKDEGGTAALMGMFYDLTQTQDGKPTGVDTGNYSQVLIDFVTHDWNEAELNRYYRATKPLFTTQIWLPTMPTLAAPRAFGVQKRAPRAVWVIHYKGQVVPPEDGTYRFVGFGDDVLIVAVNEKVVLISNWAYLNFKIHAGTPAGDCLKAGLWFDGQASKPIDLDVLCCDNGDPGGVCAAFVLIEKKGETYAMNNGHPILPIFQLAPYNTPDLPPGRYRVKFTRTPALWKAFQ